MLTLDGQEIEELGDLWRRLWAAGEAGVSVSLVVSRDGRQMARTCRTADRATFLKRPALH